jgi:hypothetical protein
LILKKFSAVFFHQFLVIKTLDPDWIRNHLKSGSISETFHLISTEKKQPILASSDGGEKKMAQKSVLRISITFLRIRTRVLAKLN